MTTNSDDTGGPVVSGDRPRLSILARLTVLVGLGGAGVAGAMAQLPVMPLLAAVGLIGMTPMARTLATRVMAGGVLGLAVGAIATFVPTLDWRSTAVPQLCGLTFFSVLVATLRNERLAPEMSVPDGLVLAIGGLVGLTLGAPYLGRSEEDVLLDLARNVDQVNHFTMLRDLLLSPEGLPGTWAADVSYPVAVHATMATLLNWGGVDAAVGLVVPFAWSMVGAATFAALVLGWIAVRVGGSAGPPEESGSRQVWTAAAFGGVGIASGTFAAPFELGHAPFLASVAGVVAASWLALQWLTRSRTSAFVIAGLGVVGAAGGYPLLLGGLVPASVRVVLPRRTPMLGRALVILLALVAVSAVATATPLGADLAARAGLPGVQSTPLGVSVVLGTVTGVMVRLSADRGFGLLPIRAIHATIGLAAIVVVVIVVAQRQGVLAQDSYYAGKLAEGAWLSAVPVFVALVVSGVHSGVRRRSEPIRVACIVLALSAVVVLIAILPVGREPGSLAGVRILERRLAEAERASGEVQVAAAARLAGPSKGDASLIAEPRGWFYPVSKGGEGSVRQPALAAFWMSAIRGGRTGQTDTIANCLLSGTANAEAIPCVERWLLEDGERRLTVAVGATPSASAWRELASRYPDRMVIVPIDGPGS